MSTASQIHDICQNGLFKIRPYVRCSRMNIGINANDGTFCKRAIVVNAFRDKEFFIPMFKIHTILSELNSLSREEPFGNRAYYIPLSIGGTDTKRSFIPILKQFSLGGTGDLLIKVSTSNEAFIGREGLIFNEDWTPIMITGYNIMYSEADCRWHITNPKMILHPSVFSKPNIVTRGLINHIVPYYGNNVTYLGTANIGAIVDLGNPAPVIISIEDFSHMIITPTVPTMGVDQDSIHEFLSRQFLNES